MQQVVGPESARIPEQMQIWVANMVQLSQLLDEMRSPVTKSLPKACELFLVECGRLHTDLPARIGLWAQKWSKIYSRVYRSHDHEKHLGGDQHCADMFDNVAAEAAKISQAAAAAAAAAAPEASQAEVAAAETSQAAAEEAAAAELTQASTSFRKSTSAAAVCILLPTAHTCAGLLQLS